MIGNSNRNDNNCVNHGGTDTRRRRTQCLLGRLFNCPGRRRRQVPLPPTIQDPHEMARYYVESMSQEEYEMYRIDIIANNRYMNEVERSSIALRYKEEVLRQEKERLERESERLRRETERLQQESEELQVQGDQLRRRIVTALINIMEGSSSSSSEDNNNDMGMLVNDINDVIERIRARTGTPYISIINQLRTTTETPIISMSQRSHLRAPSTTRRSPIFTLPTTRSLIQPDKVWRD